MNYQNQPKYVALEFTTTLPILIKCRGYIPSLQILSKCVEEGESIIDAEQEMATPVIDHENEIVF
jgi:hypothetical protein